MSPAPHLQCEWRPDSLHGAGHPPTSTSKASALPSAGQQGSWSCSLRAVGTKSSLYISVPIQAVLNPEVSQYQRSQELQRGRPDPAAWFTHTRGISQFMDTLKLSSAKLSGGAQDLIFFSAPFLLPLKQESLCFFLLHCASVFSS